MEAESAKVLHESLLIDDSSMQKKKSWRSILQSTMPKVSKTQSANQKRVEAEATEVQLPFALRRLSAHNEALYVSESSGLPAPIVQRVVRIH